MPDVLTALGLAGEAVTRLLETATRAPSPHNTQPWRFRVRPDVIELHADRARLLRVIDPDGRELRLACGAALLNLRLALAGEGIRPLVTVMPDPTRPDLLAAIRHGGHKRATPEQLRLLRAVARRHTNREPFAAEQVTTAELHALRRAALEEGAWLHVVTDPGQRSELRRMAAHAHRAQLADARYQAELDAWTGVSPTRTDGVPATAGGPQPRPERTWVLRDFGGAARPAAVGEVEPTIAVLTSHLSGRSAEVRCGAALQRVLLTATDLGLATSFLSQLVEVERTREDLRRLLGGTRPPQAVLRIGRGWPVPATPRRPVSELVDVPVDAG